MAERGRPRSFDRAAALRRAMEVFWSKGYEGASMAELTAAMGINSPSLYAAFGCKEALFREAVELYVATDGAASWDALRERPTAREAVEAMLRAAAENFSDPHRPPGCLVVLGATDRTAENEGMRRHLADRRRHLRDLLRERLARGLAEGELPAGTDAARLADFYITVLHGLSIQARDGVPRAALLGVVDCAMSAWEGLLPGPRAARGRRGKSAG